MRKLIQFGESKISPASLMCISRVHNEANIIGDFFRHHRNLGTLSFLMIDDRSTDETAKILIQQPDVTLFCPAEGSHYREDKKVWVQELLNEFCTDSWALCLDVDEHLIYRDMEHKSIHGLIAQLERESADSLPAIMLDMYADKNLKEHTYSGGNLKREFPYFDDLLTYRIMHNNRSKLFHARGGMRYRLFAREPRRLIQPGLPLRLNARQSRLAVEAKRKIDQIAKIVRDPILGKAGYRPNSFKVPLIFWTKDMTWDEHKIKKTKKQSKQIAALLHFKMAKGIGGIEYLADRGQHVGDSLYARWILSTENLDEINPVCSMSRRYTGAESVFGGKVPRGQMGRLRRYRKFVKYSVLRHLPGSRGHLYHRKLQQLTEMDRFEEAVRRSAGLTCIDLGANVGEFTVKMAATAGRVVAFEPDPWALGRLRGNLAGLDNVEIVAAAAGLGDGTVPLYRHRGFEQDPDFYSLSSSIVADKINVTEEEAVEVRQIDFIRWLEARNEDIGILKMDIEGAEVELLETLFDRPVLLARIGYIFAETHEDRVPGHEPRVKALRDRARKIGQPNIDLYWH